MMMMKEEEEERKTCSNKFAFYVISHLVSVFISNLLIGSLINHIQSLYRFIFENEQLGPEGTHKHTFQGNSINECPSSCAHLLSTTTRQKETKFSACSRLI